LLFYKFLEEFNANFLIDDPVCLNAGDMHSVGNQFEVATVLVHLFPKVDVVDVLHIAGSANQDIRAVGLWPLDIHSQGLLILHLDGLLWHLFEVTNETLYIDKLFENVFDQLDSCNVSH
jgi:hypothetical protein